MPTFKDPSRTRTYMRLYMYNRRLKLRLDRAARIQRNREAFLEHERLMKEKRNALLNS